MLAREVQVDRGLFKIAMPEQHLDRAQVGAGFEQMRREAVPQGMGMDVLVLEAGAESGLLTRCPEHLGGDRAARRYASCCRETASRWACAKSRQ